MQQRSSLREYYAARALEYDRVYEKPERIQELAALRDAVAEYFVGSNVLEIACGTGYWTTAYAAGANSVLATDVGEEVLAVAREKLRLNDRVGLARADAFSAPSTIVGSFDACFVGFWWSHIMLDALDGFLRGLHHRLGVGARVMIIDNCFVPGSNAPIDRVDDRGNSFQLRKLIDGSTHEVLKNFPNADTVKRYLEPAGAGDIVVDVSRDFWQATYVVREIVPQPMHL